MSHTKPTITSIAFGTLVTGIGESIIPGGLNRFMGGGRIGAT